MSSKTIAIALSVLVVLTNGGWALWMYDTAITLDGYEQQTSVNAEVTRVLIDLATNPLRSTTSGMAVQELQQRLPDVLAKAHGDTVEVSALQLIFGPHGMQRIIPM